MSVKINLMPKKSGEGFGQRERRPFFYFFAFIFFAISLAAFSLMFVWQNYFFKNDLLESKAKNDALDAEISEKMKSPSLTANMKANSAVKILANHLYTSKFYRLLESLTLKNIFYKDFSLNVTVVKNDIAQVKISGEADSFNALAKQLEIFHGSKDITDVSFSNAQMNKDGKIDFSVGLSFEISSMRFFADKK